MFNFSRTKRQKVLTAVSYTSIAFIVMIGTFILVQIARGYDFDFNRGEVVQNGLLLVASEPVAADIYLNGENIRKDTPYRRTLSVGEHTITLKQSTFRDWTRKFNVNAGEVIWLGYPLLIPETLNVREVAKTSSGFLMVPSPDSSEFALSQGLTINGYESARPDRPPEVYNLAEKLPGYKGGIIEIIWSSNNKQIFARLDGESGRRDILLDTSNATIKDLTNSTADLREIKFLPKEDDEFYGLRNNQLIKFQVDGAISTTIADQADKYAIFDDLALTWSAETKRVALRSPKEDTVLDTLPLDTVSDLALSKHDDKLIAAISTPASGVIILHDINSTNRVSIENKTSAEELLFSPGANYMIARTGANFWVYDFEEFKHYEFSLNAEMVTNLRWATGAQVLAVINGNKSIIFDFEGSNQYELAGAIAGNIMMSPDQQHIINLASSEVDGTPIIVDIDLTQ